MKQIGNIGVVSFRRQVTEGSDEQEDERFEEFIKSLEVLEHR